MKNSTEVKRTGPLEILSAIPPHLLPTKEKKWEPSDNSISLTEEEKQEALNLALQMKIAKINEERYWENVRNPPKPRQMNSEELLEAVLNKAKATIQNFSLNDAEMEIYVLLSYYFTKDERFEESGNYFLHKGILLYGNIGCGKTTALNLFRTIVNPPFPIIACREVSNQLKSDGFEVIEKYAAYPNVCFDDLGTESESSHFGNKSNVMSEMVLSRYDRKIQYGFMTHLTTNLSSDQIEEKYGQRVRSRLREMINQIKFPTDSQDKRR